MGKLDELRRAGSAAAAESMGAGVPLLHGATAIGPTQVPAHLQGVTRVKNVAQIPVEKIGPDPDQPREEFDEEALGRLADSLKARGQLQPIRVRWDEGRGLYVILVGERRWRAARMAGLPTLSAVIV
jgi:ParB family chromosome partitioning protein